MPEPIGGAFPPLGDVANLITVIIVLSFAVYYLAKNRRNGGFMGGERRPCTLSPDISLLVTELHTANKEFAIALSSVASTMGQMSHALGELHSQVHRNAEKLGVIDTRLQHLKGQGGGGRSSVEPGPPLHPTD